MALPGGAAAIREPWRTAAAYLERAGRPVPGERWDVVRQSLRVNAPPSSGMGRLFDAVAALGLRVTYEGQAAAELERLAESAAAEPDSCAVTSGAIVGADLVRAAHDDLAAGRPPAELAAALHEGVALAAARVCEAAAEPRRALGRLVPEPETARLYPRDASGASAYSPIGWCRRTNGGLSYGQAAVAAERISSCA